MVEDDEVLPQVITFAYSEYYQVIQYNLSQISKIECFIRIRHLCFQATNDWQDQKMCLMAGFLSNHPLSTSKSVSEFTADCKSGCDQDSNCKVAYANTADQTKVCDLYGDECKPGTAAATGNYIYVKST